jgi:hypothetical protein
MENKMSVNKLSGWGTIAASTNHESFIIIFGREPQGAELQDWISGLRETAEADIERSFPDRLVQIREDQWRMERDLCAWQEGGI